MKRYILTTLGVLMLVSAGYILQRGETEAPLAGGGLTATTTLLYDPVICAAIHCTWDGISYAYLIEKKIPKANWPKTKDAFDAIKTTIDAQIK